MPLGIGLPVVLKAHQPGVAMTRPGDELEGTRTNGVFGGGVEGVRRHQDDRVAHDADGQRRIRHFGMDAHRVLVEHLDALDIFQPAADKVVGAGGGILDAQHVELHRFGVELAAVVEQHPFAQPEGPGGELLVGLPALGQAGDKLAALVDIGQAVKHGGGGMHPVVLIMLVRVEARDIEARAIVQGAAALRMPLAGGGWIDEAEGGHAGKRPTGGSEEGAARHCAPLVCPFRGHDSSPYRRTIHVMSPYPSG